MSVEAMVIANSESAGEGARFHTGRAQRHKNISSASRASCTGLEIAEGKGGRKRVGVFEEERKQEAKSVHCGGVEARVRVRACMEKSAGSILFFGHRATTVAHLEGKLQIY